MTSLADFFPLRVLYPSPSRPKLNSIEFEGIKKPGRKKTACYRVRFFRLSKEFLRSTSFEAAQV